MKVWVTKYALTQGIFQIEGGIHFERTSMFCQDGSGHPEAIDSAYHSEGREWHRTEESAKLKAEAMRRAKIKALKKQIAKLGTLRFT